MTMETALVYRTPGWSHVPHPRRPRVGPPPIHARLQRGAIRGSWRRCLQGLQRKQDRRSPRDVSLLRNSINACRRVFLLPSRLGRSRGSRKEAQCLGHGLRSCSPALYQRPLPVTGEGHPALFAVPHFLTANRIHFAEKCSGRRRAFALADGRRQQRKSLRPSVLRRLGRALRHTASAGTQTCLAVDEAMFDRAVDPARMIRPCDANTGVERGRFGERSGTKCTEQSR
jgi:hypothetical protein